MTKVCQTECDACKRGEHDKCLGAPEKCICGYWGMKDTDDIKKEIDDLQ